MVFITLRKEKAYVPVRRAGEKQLGIAVVSTLFAALQWNKSANAYVQLHTGTVYQGSVIETNSETYL
jgi:hypothetical protein